MSAAGKVVQKITKKPGRKRIRRGPKSATPDQKLGAKKANMNVSDFKKLSTNEQKKWIKEAKKVKAKTKKKSDGPKRSKADDREIKRIVGTDPDSPSTKLPGRVKTGPEGAVPVQQGPLLSKIELPKDVSKARRRDLIKTGQAKQVRGKGGKSKLVGTGQYAPPRQAIAEEMGLTGRGKLASEEELMEMGGFEIKQKGGIVKRNRGGSVRGVGAAQRGFGNARYSNKLY